MKSINKILLLFIAFMLLSFGVTWEILQSKWVGNQVSSLITGFLESKFDAQVSFDNLEFKVYPPGAEIQNLKLKGKQDHVKFTLNAKGIGVYFNAFDVFKTDFVVNNVLLKDAKIFIKTKKNTIKDEDKNQATPDKHKIVKIINEIPINSISLQSVKIHFNEDISGNIHDLKLNNKRESIEVKGRLSQLSYLSFNKYLSKLDEININANINEEKIDLLDLKLVSGFSALSISGDIKNFLSQKHLKYDLLTKGSTPLNYLHNWLDFKSVGTLSSGMAKFSSTLIGKGKSFQSEIDIELEDFLTDFVYGEEANVSLSINNKSVRINSLNIKNEEQALRLIESFELFNFESKKFVEEPIIVDAKSLQMNNFLRYLKDDISILDGELSGKIRFDLYEKSFSFKPVGSLRVDRIFLKASDDIKIFDIKNLVLRDTEFVVDNGTFLMNLIAENESTNLSLTGKINKNTFVIEMPTSYLELDKFSEIVGLKLKGKGTLNFKIIRNEKSGKLVMISRKDFKDLDIEGFKLDKLKGRVNYLIADNTIDIKDLNATSSKSEIKLSGVFNYSNMKFDGEYNIQKLNFTEIKKILSPLMGDMSLSSKEIFGQWSSKGRVGGVASLDGIELDGDFKGHNNYFFEESIDQIHAKVRISRGNLSISNLIAKKGRGLIRGSYSLDLKKLGMRFDLGLYKIGIQDINYYNRLPISLRGDLNGSLRGSYSNGLEIKTDLNLRNAYVFSEKYEDSFIKIKLSEDNLFADVNLFKDKVGIKSDVYFKKGKNLSSFDLNIQFEDIKKLFGLFSGVDLVNSSAKGEVDYSLKTKFNFNNLSIQNLESNVKKFNFQKSPISASYMRKDPEVLISDGEIKKWDLSIRGKRFYIYSQGNGNIDSNYKTSTQLKIDASIVEVFNNVISKANGNIRGKFEYGQLNGQDEYEAYIASSNLSLNSSLIPTGISKSAFKVSFIDKKLVIEKLKAQLVSGSFNAKGEVDLGNVIPNIDIRYSFDNAGFTILNKSNLMLTGKGRLIGKNFPYTLSGDLFIQKCSITNELTDFGFGGNSLGSSDIPFLPGQEERLLSQFLNFNVNLSTREPIFIRNSLIDVGLVGNVQLLGGEIEPKLSGDINLATRNNKISFKNNEFLLTKSNVSFNEEEPINNPMLDFNAKSKIGDYSVNVSLFGNLKDYKLNLSSEPNLNKTDVLSLIAFGYTEDISNNLSDAEKESMTSAGVGSIIFDSFKINETLKNEFGLQVNLGTEISQDQSSYLEGRSSDSSVSTGRVRSATTVEVRKKIDDATSMSLTSTVGASSTQKQSINVNYNLNTNVSVEGIYESISTDEAETINDDNSFGADIKWQWTFK